MKASVSYLTTLEHYAGEKITFLGESVSGPYAQVRSRITTDRRVEISIEDRLLESDVLARLRNKDIKAHVIPRTGHCS